MPPTLGLLLLFAMPAIVLFTLALVERPETPMPVARPSRASPCESRRLRSDWRVGLGRLEARRRPNCPSVGRRGTGAGSDDARS
jgi:hypothetical protein